MGAVCSRRHRLVRFEVLSCEAGHEHRVFRCPMRLGNRAHGERVVVPPLQPGCER